MSKKTQTLSVTLSLFLVSSMFASSLFAANVVTNGDLKVSGMIDNTGGDGIKFPDGNIQTSACSGCAGGILSILLGGTGAADSITALANLGGVNKTGDTMTGNLSVPSLFLGGNLSLPTTSATTGIIKVNSENLIHSYGTNSFFAGRGAGNTTMTGGWNTGVGRASLGVNTSGGFNSGIGSLTLMNNSTGSGNTAVGYSAMYNNIGGFSNTAIGISALDSNLTGSYNTAVGGTTLEKNTGGYGNTAIGFYAGTTSTAANANTTGSNNTFIGYYSGPGTATQLTNATAIGANALVGASDSLVLGAPGVKVGIGTATPTEKLDVVGNVKISGTLTPGSISSTGDLRMNDMNIYLRTGSDTNHGLGWYGSGKVFTGAESIDGPVLYGYTGGALGSTAGGQKTLMKWHWSDGFDFYGYVRVHTLSGGSTSACLDAFNTISTCSSDARMKKDITTLSEKMDVLEALAKLRGVMFTWDRTNDKAARMGNGRDMGMIAQEVEGVFPEVVHTDNDGYKSLDYPKLVAFLVEVNKAQQAQLAAQKEDIGRLALLMQKLSARVSTMESGR